MHSDIIDKYDLLTVKQFRNYCSVNKTICFSSPQAGSKLGDIITTMDRFEPKNAFLYYSMAQVFCRMVGMNSLINVP